MILECLRRADFYAGVFVLLLFLPAASHAACSPLPTETADFDGGCASDILLQNSTTGALAIWFMNGATISSNSSVAVSPIAPWALQGVGDFNNDGNADMLWRNYATGELDIWLMNGATILSSAALPYSPDNDWSVQAIADFNQDGFADILWRDHVTGELAIWFMNGSTVTSSSVLAYSPGDTWSIAGVGDFNNDGVPDLLWRNMSNGELDLWLMNGATVSSSLTLAASPSPAWSIQGIGDFNGDGYADILWRDDSGDVNLWLMNGSTIVSSNDVGAIPSSWTIQGVGDFNSDGQSDIVWRNSNGDVNIWFMDSGTIASSADLGVIDTAWQIPTPPLYGVPAPAKAVGYTTNTFNSTMLGTTIGTLQEFNFFSLSQPSDWFTQNGDGSLALTGQPTPGRGYGALVSPADYNSTNTYKYQGIAFGGGMYYQVTFSFTGTQTGDPMSVQMYDVLSLSGYTPQNVTGYMGIEIDGPEFNRPGSSTQYGVSCHNYYYPSGGPKARIDPTVLTSGGSPITIPSGSLAGSNTYGMLWVPATATTQGYIQWYFNGVQVGPTVAWNQYNVNQAFPPSNTASTVCNVLDTLRMVPVVGTASTATPMTITSVQIWQGPGADNAQY